MGEVMKKVLPAIFYILLGAFLSMSIYYGKSIRSNLDSISENVDAINLMLNEMTTNVEKSNAILKEMTK